MGSPENSWFAAAGARNDIPLPLHMLVVELPNGQWLSKSCLHQRMPCL